MTLPSNVALFVPSDHYILVIQTETIFRHLSVNQYSKLCSAPLQGPAKVVVSSKNNRAMWAKLLSMHNSLISNYFSLKQNYTFCVVVPLGTSDHTKELKLNKQTPKKNIFF